MNDEEKQKIYNDKKEKERIISLIVNAVETMMSRQRKCQSQVVRFTLLANTIMMVFDISSAAAGVFAEDLDPELKSKLNTTISKVQNDLEDMLVFMQQNQVGAAMVGCLPAGARM